MGKKKQTSCLALKSITCVLFVETTSKLTCDRSAAGVFPSSYPHRILQTDSRRGIYKCNRPYCVTKGPCQWSWPFFNCKCVAMKQPWLHVWPLLWPTGRPRGVTTVAFTASMPVTTQEEGEWHFGLVITMVLISQAPVKLSGTHPEICRPHSESHRSKQTLQISSLLRNHKKYKFPKTYTVSSIKSNLEVANHGVAFSQGSDFNHWWNDCMFPIKAKGDFCWIDCPLCRSCGGLLLYEENDHLKINSPFKFWIECRESNAWNFSTIKKVGRLKKDNVFNL